MKDHRQATGDVTLKLHASTSWFHTSYKRIVEQSLLLVNPGTPPIQATFAGLESQDRGQELRPSFLNAFAVVLIFKTVVQSANTATGKTRSADGNDCLLDVLVEASLSSPRLREDG